MALPKDPNMLLSYINMNLRDKYPDLDELCATECCDRHRIEEALSAAGFVYDENLKRFVNRQ